MRRFLEDNALTLVAFALFAITFVAMIGAGFAHDNDERLLHGLAAQTLGEYVVSGSFWEAVAENWESEFLQMAIFVVITAVLHQRGSSESKRIEEIEEVDEDPRSPDVRKRPGVPWPVRHGGAVLALYRHSLTIALMLLFVVSIVIHAFSGRAAENEERSAHGEPGVSLTEYVGSSRFWFEAMQNWQSEFLAVAVLVLLTIWLRQQGSPQSKPVAAKHKETGE